MRPGQKWLVTVAVLSVGLALALSLRNSASASGPRFFPRCGFHALTSLHCPGCGNTRATRALLHGDIGGAVRQNVLFVIGLPFLLFAVVRSWTAWIFPGKWKPFRSGWRQSHTLILVWIVVVFGLVRNLPQWPFSWLAPEAAKIRESRESEAP